MGVKVFWIDIVGTCNLRCPSCPVGNYREADFAGAVRRRGFMNFGYFREVLAKIEREIRTTFAGSNSTIGGSRCSILRSQKSSPRSGSMTGSAAA
jgi:hypothetical protein